MIQAWIYTFTERYAEAVRECEKAIELVPDQFTLADCAPVYARAGQRDKALELLEQVKKLSADRWLDPAYVAFIYWALRDKERTFQWFERAYEERSGSLAYLNMSVFFDPLRSDPRFHSLLRRMNFPE